jgi:hypothetical protein
MTTYTEIFGGGTIYPAEPTFVSLAFSEDVTLQWPIEQAVGGDNIVAKIIELHPTTTSLSVILSDAREVSTGYTVMFYNAEASTVTVKDTGGNTLLTVASGLAWQIYLRDNSTANGLWRTFQQGAGTSTANAASLAGAGLKAISTTLNEMLNPVSRSTSYVILEADRANVQQWTGASGTFTLPTPASVGADWFVGIKNAGTGSVTITPSAGTVDGSASLILGVDESAWFYSDGTNYFSMGLGQAVNSVFDFIVINVSGTGNYTLAGAELNRIANEFIGVLTGNRSIIVPASVQQYWVDNETTGAFTLTVKTLSGTGVVVPQGQRTILYCNGTDVINAETLLVSTPVSVVQGGTGLTSVTQGDMLYGSAANTYSLLAKSATATRYISNTGASNNPAWAQVELTNGVSGILPAGNGGTGNAFTLFSGPATSIKTYTLPNATTTILTTNAAVTVPQGGTGLTSVTQGDILYSSASNTLATLAKDANATRYLANTGTSNSPAWGQVNLANGVTGNLPVTNLNSGTSASATTFWRGDSTWAVPSATSGNTITFSSGTYWDFSLATAFGGSPGAATYTVNIPVGAIFRSSGNRSYAFDTSGFASASTINITNLGYIIGCGGRGGRGGSIQTVGDDNFGYAGIVGEDGGTAIQGPGAGNTLNITNANGFIWGGGGAGGGGGVSADDGNNVANGGGGGGGAGCGAGGFPGALVYAEGVTVGPGSVGQNGALFYDASDSKGAGGAGAQAGSASGGAGGDGGDFGISGNNGTAPTGFAIDIASGAGGLSGKAVNFNSGTVNFLSGNSSPHVKGAVS